MKFDKRIYLVIIGSIGLYAAFLLISDLEDVYQNLTNFKIDFLPIILLLTPTSWMILFLRWNLLLKHSNINLPLKNNFGIYLTGFALSMTPGKIGELLKSQLYKEKFDVPRKITAPLIIVERIYNLVGLIIISILGIFFFDFSAYVVGTATILLAIVFILISNKQLFERFLSLLKKIKFTSNYAASLIESYDVVKRSTHGYIFIYISGLSAMFWIVESLTVYFVFLSFEINFLDYLNVISIYATSIILGAASFLPEGIGVTEGSLVALLSMYDIEISVAFSLVILIRIFTLWYSVAAGFIALKISGSLSFH